MDYHVVSVSQTRLEPNTHHSVWLEGEPPSFPDAVQEFRTTVPLTVVWSDRHATLDRSILLLQ